MTIRKSCGVLQQQFDVAEASEACVSDNTHIRTHEGWPYLAVIVYLDLRVVIGWSMQSRIKKELVVDVLLMSVWRRRPKGTVTVHTDQG